MNPCLTTSSIAVILANNSQIPRSDLGMILTIKKIFTNPKNNAAIRFNSEYEPCENQRAYGIEANVFIFYCLKKLGALCHLSSDSKSAADRRQKFLFPISWQAGL